MLGMTTPPPLAEALGKVPSGLFILTVRHKDEETGMLASWVMQAGFEPPMLTVAVRKDRYVAAWLEAGSPFVLNQVPEPDAAHLLRHFARGFEPGAPAFEGMAISRTEQRVPVLEGSAGHLQCLPRGHVDSGDHRIFVAEIIDGQAVADRPPMVHVRRTGLRY
jgi:flavin reductase (DIM6/NTAB) family NADH-FMN oxidoreductase RutF